MATAISEQLDALTRDGSPVVDQLAEQLSAERPAAGDSAPDAGEAASEVLEALGAEVTPLENGGSVINWGSESSWLPGTTALQAGELPAAPVFQVTGGIGAGLLRTSTGDAYADGRWAQLDPADIPYESGADLPSLVASRFTGSGPNPVRFIAACGLEPAGLARPPTGQINRPRTNYGVGTPVGGEAFRQGEFPFPWAWRRFSATAPTGPSASLSPTARLSKNMPGLPGT